MSAFPSQQWDRQSSPGVQSGAVRTGGYSFGDAMPLRSRSKRAWQS